MPEANRNKIRQYFQGKSQTGPIALMVVGVLLLLTGIGVLLLLGGIGWYLVNKFRADLTGESEVDQAVQRELAAARERAMKMLNVVDEQVQDVPPILFSGRGFEPETTAIRKQSDGLQKLASMLGLQKLAAKLGLQKLANRFDVESKKREDNLEDDPVYMVRIGSDNKCRCSLLSVSVFMFGETQLYIYFCNVDLTTGLVYSEGTHEYFYTDISAISFVREREKIYNYKTKKYQRILFEYVKIFASGSSYSAAMSTDADHSLIEREFTGMKNLIRERKNSK